MKRKSISFSVELLERAETAARGMNVDLSHLVRLAMDQFLGRMETEGMERELAAACQNYKEFNKRYAADWSGFETTMR